MADTTISDLVFAQLKTYPDNQLCFDCCEKVPTWASVTNGIFLCMACAGIHRSFGAHISAVRSLELDTWSEPQLKMMSLGGNLKLKKLFAEYELLNLSLEDRYRTTAADYYRRALRGQIQGEATMEEQPSKLAGQQPMQQSTSQSEESMGNSSDAHEDLSVSGMLWESVQAVKETGSFVVQSVNETMESTGAKERFGQVTQQVGPTLKNVTSKVVSTSSSLYAKGQEYPQVQQATQTVNLGVQKLTQVGTAAFTKADETSGGQLGNLTQKAGTALSSGFGMLSSYGSSWLGIKQEPKPTQEESKEDSFQKTEDRPRGEERQILDDFLIEESK